MIKTAIFDLDGTLLDTSEFIYQAFDHTIKTHNIEFITRKDIKKYMGMKLSEMYKIFAPDIDTNILVDTHREFQKQNLHLSKPYLKVEESLHTLKDAEIKMAVLTARSKLTSVRILELAGISHFFETIISDEDVTKLKPDPEGIFKILSTFNTKPEEAIMIGDTFTDIQAGKNAGLKTIAVVFGFHGEEVKKYDPDFVVYSFAEIPPIILDTKTSV